MRPRCLEALMLWLCDVVDRPGRAVLKIVRDVLFSIVASLLRIVCFNLNEAVTNRLPADAIFPQVPNQLN